MSRLVNHKKTAINVCTKADYNTLMKLLEEEGWRWCNGRLPTDVDEKWEQYNENFCLDYFDNFAYASRDFYKREGYRVITFKKFMEHWDRGYVLWHDYNEDFILKVDDI